MANTPKPPPPAPFGSPAELAGQQADLEGVSYGLKQFLDQRRPGDLTGSFYERISIRGEIGAQAGDLAGQVRRQDDVNMARQPWVLTCQSWITLNRYIIAAVNPKEVQWQLAQRSAVQKTRIGEILHIWRDPIRGTYYDEPQLTISFQSGNIMPIRTKPLKKVGTKDLNVGAFRANAPQSVGNTGAFREIVNSEGDLISIRIPQLEEPEESPIVPPGLLNFYEFLSLVDEQKILPTGDTNFVYLIYNSRMFPNMTLVGLFTPAGLSWTDSSDSPNEVGSWSANFTVYDTFPRLNDKNALVQFFQDAGWGRI